MNSRSLIDWGLIILIYGAYAGAIVASAAFDLPTELGVAVGKNGDKFLSEFETWAFISMGVSLFATIFWYVMGEWGPAPSPTSKPILVWLLALIVASVGGIVAYFLYDPAPASGLEILTAVYIGAAIIFYYLATVLFSPVNAKFVVPGSKLFRKW